MRSRRARLTAFGVGLAAIWGTVVAVARLPEVDLTIVLLAMVVEVLVVAVLTGPVLGVLAALAAVAVVNWYLVPPYHTLAVANAENVAALVVFAVVAVTAALLVELGIRGRAQAEALGDVLVGPPSAGDEALEPVRRSLALDRVALCQVGPDGERVTLRTAGPDPGPDERPILDVPVVGPYRLVGYGPARLAIDPDFVAALGMAAVRAYESQRLVDERRRADDLAAVDRARAALLAGVGHDLRTPLTGLRVAVETLRSPDAALSAADRADLLDTVAVSVSRLDELISNLLDLSRLEAGALISRPEPTDVGEVVARAVLGCAEPDRVEVDIAEDLPSVRVDPALLERVIANLLSNALRYAPPGPPVLVAAVCATGATGDAPGPTLLVRDHGPGIPPAERAAVFQPFRQLRGRADGGSGLGLAIVDGFCQAMDVGVTLDDTPGGGLTVRLTLPLVREMP